MNTWLFVIGLILLIIGLVISYSYNEFIYLIIGIIFSILGYFLLIWGCVIKRSYSKYKNLSLENDNYIRYDYDKTTGDGLIRFQIKKSDQKKKKHYVEDINEVEFMVSTEGTTGTSPFWEFELTHVPDICSSAPHWRPTLKDINNNDPKDLLEQTNWYLIKHGDTITDSEPDPVKTGDYLSLRNYWRELNDKSDILRCGYWTCGMWDCDNEDSWCNFQIWKVDENDEIIKTEGDKIAYDEKIVLEHAGLDDYLRCACGGRHHIRTGRLEESNNIWRIVKPLGNTLKSVLESKLPIKDNDISCESDLDCPEKVDNYTTYCSNEKCHCNDNDNDKYGSTIRYKANGYAPDNYKCG